MVIGFKTTFTLGVFRELQEVEELGHKGLHSESVS
jgi:hypothetical protein